MKYKVPFVNYSLQYRNLEKEIDAAMKDVLLRGDLINRSDVENFEKNLAFFAGTKYAVGLNSGTDALIFSLMASGIGAGDEVITVSHTFVASMAAIVHCGAKPILIDVGEDFVMKIDEFKKAITPKTKAVIPVHLNGHLCDMEKLMAIAKEHNLIVIEDAAQALGAKLQTANGKWQMAGSFGQAGCFSFYPAKILGCFGDGGAITTNDEKVAEKCRLLRDHGQKTKTDLICYGFNSRLDNLQAAILNVKIRYLPKWLERRREIAGLYFAGLRDVSDIKLPQKSDKRYFDVYQNYVLRAQKRDELFNFLKEKGVETLIKDPIPNHWHKGLGLFRFHLSNTERFAEEVISLPMYPELTDKQVEYVIDCIHNFYKQ